VQRLNTFAAAASAAIAIIATISAPARAQTAAFEGARIITGDGRVI